MIRNGKKTTYAESIFPALVEMLADNDSGIIPETVGKLLTQHGWQLSEAANSTLPFLIKAQLYGSEDLSKQAGYIIDRMELTIKKFLTLASKPVFLLLVNAAFDTSLDIGVKNTACNSLDPLLDKILFATLVNPIEISTLIIPILLKRLIDHDLNTRLQSLLFLKHLIWNDHFQIKKRAERVIPQQLTTAIVQQLITVLTEAPNRDIRDAAIENLGYMGKEAIPAIPELAAAFVESNPQALSSSEVEVRQLVVEALKNIGTTAVIPALIVALFDKYERVRTNAVIALEVIGDEAKSAIPALIYLLEDSKSDKDLKHQAKEALDKIDPRWTTTSGIKSFKPIRIFNPTGGTKKWLTVGAGGDTKQIRSESTIVVDTVSNKIATKSLHVTGTSIWKLVDTLIDNSVSVRVSAAIALSEMGTSAKAAIPALLEALEDKDGTVRCAAVASLGQIGLGVKTVGYALANALSDGDSRVRKAAATALGLMGNKAKVFIPLLLSALAKQALERIDPEWYKTKGCKSSIPTLVYALVSENESDRNTAAQLLEQIDPHWQKTQEAKYAIPMLIRTLAIPNKNIVKFAMLVLVDFRTDAKIAVSNLIQLLLDKDKDIRRDAAQTLDKIDPQWHKTAAAKSAITALVMALANKDSNVRKAAAEALESIDSQWKKTTEAKSAIPVLIKALADKDVREAAAEALESIDSQWKKTTEAKSAILAFVKALANEDWGVRHDAAYALLRIGAEAKSAVPALAEALADENRKNIGRVAAEVLGQFGVEAKPAIPALVKALADKDSDVRKAAANALDKIDPQWRKTAATIVIPALVPLLANESFDIANRVVDDLDKFDPQWRKTNAATSAVLIWIKNLADANWHVKLAAAIALKKIGSEAKAAVSALVTVLADLANEDWHVRCAAAGALGAIGPEAKASIPTLIQALRDEDSDVRKAAAYALGDIGAAAIAAIPALIVSLSDVDWDTRVATVQALRQIGPPAATAAISALVHALADNEHYVRTGAASALDEIDPQWRSKYKTGA